jgi:creatinine amidohydrolase
VLPTVPYSCSFEHRDTGRPVSFRVTTLVAVVTDIARSSADPLVIINGHGGNQVLDTLAQELNATGSSVLLLPTRAHWDAAYAATGWPFRGHDDMHAGAMERSLLLIWEPEHVHATLPDDTAAPDRPLFSAYGMRPYTATGGIGFPSQASVAAGHAAIQALVHQMKATVKDWIHG